jgi:hypothetical protein
MSGVEIILLFGIIACIYFLAKILDCLNSIERLLTPQKDPFLDKDGNPYPGLDYQDSQEK